MSVNIHQAVWEWLLGCPCVRDMYFAFGRTDPGDTVLVPLTAYSHNVQHAYMDGSREIRYNFNLIHYAMLTDVPNSPENIDTLLDVEQLAAWVEEQDRAGAFPFLTDGTVTTVGVHESDAAHFAMQTADSVKYMFQFYVDYLTKE